MHLCILSSKDLGGGGGQRGEVVQGWISDTEEEEEKLSFFRVA